MKLIDQYVTIFFSFSPNHLLSLQVENCDSDSRAVMDEDDNGKFRLEKFKLPASKFFYNTFFLPANHQTDVKR